jgi:hypothetical protein
MIFPDRYLLVRAASIYIVVMLTGFAWVWRRPSLRTMQGAVLASFWNLPVVLLLQLAAARFGWWRVDAHGGLLFGIPVDLYFSWIWLWGALPAIAFPSLPLSLVLVLAFAVDLVLMPAAGPVVTLAPTWLIGEALGLVAGLVPAQLLARWTMRDQRSLWRGPAGSRPIRWHVPPGSSVCCCRYWRCRCCSGSQPCRSS